jgi:hypothetical protein
MEAGRDLSVRHRSERNSQRRVPRDRAADSGEDEHRQAQRALAEDAARNIENSDELPTRIIRRARR